MDVRSRPRSLTLRPRRTGRGAREHGPEETLGAASGRSVHEPSDRTRTVGFERVSHSHRQGGPSEDRALYSCNCGYVFAALVSTSVDCPHCGDAQAW